MHPKRYPMPLRLAFHCCRLLLCLLPLAAAAQTVTPTYTTNGTVNAIVTSGGSTYIGGAFTTVSAVTGQGAALNAATGAPDLSYAKANGIILATVPDGAGGWYIGGAFTTIGGQARNRIAQINASGAVTAWNPGANAIVRALAVSGSTVYVGGAFATIGGQTRNRIAALDATINTNNATAWDPDANSTVYALAVSGNTVYAGGDFTTIGGQTRNRIAALDATINTDNATAWNPDANSGVRALAVSGNTVYAGGAFTSIGVQTRNRIAALDATINTNNATAWNPDANSTVQTLAVSGSTVYAGGDFTTIGGQTRNRIAALDATINASNATAWNPSASAIVRALAVSGSTVYVGGDFLTIGGQTRNNIAALDASTGTATAWNPNANATVLALAVSGSTVYAGGQFTSIGGLTRNNIAQIDASGAVTEWDPSANGAVRALAVSGSTVYAGGFFTSIGGQTRNYIAALDATINTSNATAWNPNANNIVRALAVSGSTVYVGGDFTTIGGQPRNYIAALDATINTNMATAWNPNASAIVYALAVSGSTVYAGGAFTTIGGQTRNRIAALDATININNATAWNPSANGAVLALAVSGSTVYVGGDFITIGGQTRNYIAALDATINTNNVTAWNPNANTIVRALAVSGGTAYAGGDFTTIGGQTRNRIAALDATINTNNATAWNPNANNSVYALAVSGSTVYAGGQFTTISANPQAYFVALSASSGIATGAISGSPFTTGSAVSVPFTVIGSFNAGNVFTAQLSDAAGSFASPTAIGTLTGTASGTVSATIPAGAAAGTGYRIRVVGSTPATTGTDNGTNLTIAVSQPAITSFSPASGPVGTLVTITGTGLFNPTAFTIGGASAIVVSNTGSTLVGLVMPGAVTGAVSVTTIGGTGTGSGSFTVTATPYPATQQGSKLVGTGNSGAANQGRSVSLSADGNTAIVGGYSDNTNQGAAWVYVRAGGVWTQQGTKLVGTGSSGAAELGRCVSLSADGNTAIVGGPSDNSNMGAAWVFVRSGTTWSQQGTKLVGSGNSGAATQGRFVSLSADGNTAVVGGPLDNGSQGATWVWTRTGTTWTQQGAKLVGTGGSVTAQQGWCVSLSADGNTAIVGGPSENGFQGAAWVFVRSGTTWAQQGTRLIGTGGSATPRQGWSVAVSADGNKAIIGGYGDNSNQGAAWMFARSGTTWSQQGTKLVGTGNVGAAFQGYAVSLSADGNTAMVGGYQDNSQQGAAWVYVRSGTTWSQQGDKFVGTGSVGISYQGITVSLSADAKTAMVGGNFDNNQQGAAWVLVPGSPEINLQGNAQSIADGSVNTQAADNTAFGTLAQAGAIAKTFTIQNTGNAALNISAISLTGTGATSFAISGISPPATVAAAGSATFTVTFSPATTGAKTATVEISNDDPNEATYDFAIAACAPAIAMASQTVTQNVADNSFEAGTCSGLIANVLPSGTNPAGGNFKIKVTVPAGPPVNQPEYNGAPYVARTYDVEPTDNPNTATATITLYFTQADFTNYNANNGTEPDLPADPSDNDGKAAFRLTQQHGVSATGLPGSYTGWGGAGPANVVIDPADNNIVWNATAGRWEVTFPVAGFSGFFAYGSASGVPLPVTLVSISAKADGPANLISWTSASEQNLDAYEVERSADSRTFSTIGHVAAFGGAHTYHYSEDQPLSPVAYYRLRMLDADGTYRYGSTVNVMRGAGNGNVVVTPFPNPAKDQLSVRVDGASANGYISLCDLSGRVLMTGALNAGVATFNTQALASGVYLAVYEGNGGKVITKVTISR